MPRPTELNMILRHWIIRPYTPRPLVAQTSRSARWYIQRMLCHRRRVITVTAPGQLAMGVLS